MNSELLIPLISGILSILIGAWGTITVSALNKRILSAVGMSSLPKNPQEKYVLMAKNCKFLSQWTRYDSYNSFIFLCGILLLLGAAAITIINFESGGSTFLNRLQIGLLINSFGWLTVSSALMIGRFVQLMNLYKYASK